jgi:hypothetical protein
MPLKLLSPKPATPAQQEVMRAPVALMDTEMAGPHREPIRDIDDKGLTGQALESARPSVDLDTLDEAMKPKVAEGIPVFANQEEADQIRDASQPLTFNQAFRAARKSGKAQFKHKGNMFNTRQKDESEENWQTVLKDNKTPLLTDFVAGFERERSVSDIPAAKEVGNQLFQTKHPIDEGGSNVLLQSVGGVDPSGEHPPEPVKVIPTMIDGIKMSGKEAAEQYHDMGLMKSAPEFKTVEQAEEWIAENHGKISPKGRLLAHDQKDLLSVKNTRTAPTFKMLSAMEAPTEVEKLPVEPQKLQKVKGWGGRYTDNMIREIEDLNAARIADGHDALVPTSGFRTAKHNVQEMVSNVKAAKTPEHQAQVLSAYKKLYHKDINAYFANPTEENLAKVAETRAQREKVIDGGHSHYDAMDFSVKGMTKAQADAAVAWLQKQGKFAKLEYWGVPGKQHIHIQGEEH